MAKAINPAFVRIPLEEPHRTDPRLRRGSGYVDKVQEADLRWRQKLNDQISKACEQVVSGFSTEYVDWLINQLHSSGL